MRRRFSSRLSGTKLKKYCSLNEPFAPPSADAPLSLMTMTIVLSSSPSSAMKSSTRGDLGVGVGEEAGEDLHHPGVEALLVGRRASPTPAPTTGAPTARCPAGSRPDATWRANTSSRHASQPWSKWPRYALDVLGRRLVRRVARAGREPEEERLVGRRGAQVLEEQDAPCRPGPR